MQPIYLSTRKAATLVGCEPHLLYAHYRRYGNFRGVEPRKGKSGRLSWPADAMRAALVPCSEQWPDGMESWLELMAAVIPEADPLTAYRMGLALLGSEATMGWKPSPGQLTGRRLALDAAVVGLAVQAFVQRIEQAHAEQGPGVATQAVDWLAAVTHRSLRYATASGAAL